VKSTAKRARVLLADDHTLVAEGIGKLLEDEFELVGTVENGRLAIDVAQQLKPDVIILDISMPQMNGIEAARRLHTMVPDIKVIFLTMHSDRAMCPKPCVPGRPAMS
jgi:Response regulator containing CheY-like receiver domain and AraC-type DNA-binding domain